MPTLLPLFYALDHKVQFHENLRFQLSAKAEKLELSKNKTVFVMEDLHWIDPESYAFLKHFIKTVNRNDFIRKNMCIILTIRNDEVNNLRGVSLEGLKDDLNALNKTLDKLIKISKHNSIF